MLSALLFGQQPGNHMEQQLRLFLCSTSAPHPDGDGFASMPPTKVLLDSTLAAGVIALGGVWERTLRVEVQVVP